MNNENENCKVHEKRREKIQQLSCAVQQVHKHLLTPADHEDKASKVDQVRTVESRNK